MVQFIIPICVKRDIALEYLLELVLQSSSLELKLKSITTKYIAACTLIGLLKLCFVYGAEAGNTIFTDKQIADKNTGHLLSQKKEELSVEHKAQWQLNLQREIEAQFDTEGRKFFVSPKHFNCSLKFRVNKDGSLSKVELVPVDLKKYRTIGRIILLKVLKNIERTSVLNFPEEYSGDFIEVEMIIDRTYQLMAR